MPDVEAFTVTRYRCPYCRRRSWQSRKRAETHAAACWWNHGCKTCLHADNVYGGVWLDGCNLGEDLCTNDEEPGHAIPRSQCPLWEAVDA